MKKRVIRISILMVIFITAVVVFSFLTNKGYAANMTADIGSATLPRISFVMEGYEVNPLAGYKKEMEIATMRDTITPVHDGFLEVAVDAFGQKIKSLSYEAFTLDGQKLLVKGKEEDIKQGAKIDVSKALEENKEAALKISLQTEEAGKISYYTRIAQGNEFQAKESVEFARDFHEKALAKSDECKMLLKAESNRTSEFSTLGHITKNSGLEYVQWADLEPKVKGEITYNIQESNENYHCIVMCYQVVCKMQEEEELYNVKEFFRVQHVKEEVELADYDRVMNQVFDNNSQALDHEGINLGLAPEQIEYLANEKGTIVSFVQEREVWSYNKETNIFSRIFSFADAEGNDIRNRYDQHAVQLISMSEDGSVTFAVIGYMNRGRNEGLVGVAIYRYDVDRKFIKEEAFIPSSKSYAFTKDSLGKLMYYSDKQNNLYMMLYGSLYEIQLENGEKRIIVEKMEDGQYMASEDGHFFAYQKDGGLYDATKIAVLNLRNGKEYVVEAEEGTYIRPLGFIFNDLICGYAKAEEQGKNVSGEAVYPMHQVNILNTKGKPVKIYYPQNGYVLDISIEGNQVILNRVKKEGDIYTDIEPEYITNNEEKELGKIGLGSYATAGKGKQMRLQYKDYINNKNPKFLNLKSALFEEPIQITFDMKPEKDRCYVYKAGELRGIYGKAGEAIIAADGISGVVVSSGQAYVWERGNRALRYEIKGAEKFGVAKGESTLTACVQKMMDMAGASVNVSEERASGKSVLEIIDTYSGGEAVDLTGCEIEQILYIIGRGTPVIAFTDHENAILLVGYDQGYVTYVNPADESKKTVFWDRVKEMCADGGKVMVGYVR